MRILGMLAIVVGLVLSASGAQASDLGQSRKEIFARQLGVLDGRLTQQYAGSVRLQPKDVSGAVARNVAVPRFTGRYTGQYLKVARSAARRHGIPEDLFLRLIQQESGWNPRARSHKGAMGLAQLMPGTARLLKVDPRDPVQNIEGGARYLAAQYREFRNWRLALAAYNAGPHAVKKYGGVPPYRETQGYVKAILGR